MNLGKTFYNYIKNLYKENGAEWQDINVFGIRNALDMKKDVWNDYIGICWNGKCKAWKGTTDPSVFYTMKPMNKKGTAHICLGHHKKIWKIGIHSKKYKALVNRWDCGRVKVWRDADKSFTKTDKDIIEKGIFYTNLHRASSRKDVEKIGRYSAGCQVVRNKKDFDELMKICVDSKQKKFNYFLFDIKTFSDIVIKK